MSASPYKEGNEIVEELTCPTINLGRPLSNLIKSALRNEHGHDLLAKRIENEKTHEERI